MKPPLIDTKLANAGATQLSADFYLSKYKLLPRFLERYALREELGSGGFGFVCSAVDKITKLEVAVKFILRNKISPQGWTNDCVFGMVPRECHLVRSLQHPNIIGFVDYFQDTYVSYLVTELHGSPWTDISSSLPSPVLSIISGTSPVSIQNSIIENLSPPLTPLPDTNDLIFNLKKRPPCDLFEYVVFYIR